MTMRVFLFLLPSIFFVQVALAAAPNPSEYAYEARLNTGPVQQNQVIKATLSREILQQTGVDFGNLQVLDDLNAEVPFTLFDSPAAPVRTLGKFKVSSADEQTPPENLLDDNRLTAFAFDQKIDAQSAAVITLDFGKIVDLHRLEIWPTSDAKILSMELRHGLRNDNLKTLRRKTEFSPLIDSNFPPLKWLEISLWGTQVTLQDINAFQREQAELYFTAEPERRYRVVYGGNIDNKRYKSRVSKAQKFDQSFGFTKPVFNPLANPDLDADNVLNEADNCPLVSNSGQVDSDEDGIGDACDNAKEVKNYNQADVDGDGVGDIIDNCKLTPNLNQKDKDKDGFGDACDNAYAKENGLANQISQATGGTSLPYGLIGALLALVATIGIGFWVGTKRQK